MDDKTITEISVAINDSMIAFINKKTTEWNRYLHFYKRKNNPEMVAFFTGAIDDLKRRRIHLKNKNKKLREKIKCR